MMYADDMSLVDGSETVTVTLVRQTRTEISEVANCLRRVRVRPNGVFGGVELQGDEINWHVPTGQLAENELQPGDEIKDSLDAVFVILSCELQTLASRWLCSCRRRGGTA